MKSTRTKQRAEFKAKVALATDEMTTVGGGWARRTAKVPPVAPPVAERNGRNCSHR